MAIEFYAGSEHVAHVELLNTTPWDWIYEAKFKLNGTTVATKSVSVPAGASRVLDFTISMPTQPVTVVATVSVSETSTGTDLGTHNFDTIEVVAEPVPAVVVTAYWD